MKKENDVLFEYNLYLQGINKRLKNLLKTRPCSVNLLNTPDTVIVQDLNSKKQKAFIIDFSKTEKEIVYEIEQWLKETIYPVMKKKIVIISEENKKSSLQDILRSEKSILDLLSNKKEKVFYVDYRIEKVYILKNVIFVRDLQTNGYFKYSLKIPYSLLLNNYIYKNKSIEAFECFDKHSVLIKKLN